MKQNWLTRLAAVTVSASLLMISAPGASASSKGRRNTAIGLGAATIYSLLRGKTTQGLILGAGTAYAYSRYRKSRKAKRRRARLARSRYYYGSPYSTGYYYNSPYRSGYYSRYSSSSPYRYSTSPYRTRYYGGTRSRVAAYRSSDSSRPPGWSHGRKRGWRGHSVPPGHWRGDRD